MLPWQQKSIFTIGFITLRKCSSLFAWVLFLFRDLFQKSIHGSTEDSFRQPSFLIDFEQFPKVVEELIYLKHTGIVPACSGFFLIIVILLFILRAICRIPIAGEINSRIYDLPVLFDTVRPILIWLAGYIHVFLFRIADKPGIPFDQAFSKDESACRICPHKDRTEA